MAAIIEETPIHIPADAWAKHVTQPAHGEDIPALVDAYLARGGKITELESGITSERDETLDAFTRKIVRTSKFTMESHIEFTAKRRRQQSANQRARHEKLAAQAALLLDTVRTRKELTEALGVSDGLAGRILRDYFPNDPRTKGLFNVRYHKDQAALELLREAIASGMTGINNLCRHCNVGGPKLRLIAKRNGITLPKGKSGFQQMKEKRQ